MGAYETIFILKSSLTDEETAGHVDKIKDVIQRAGGEVVALENWGKKKLAYEVRKEKRGTYCIAHFKGTGTTVFELSRTCRLNESVIQSMTVKISPEKLGNTAQIKEERPVLFRDKDAVPSR